MYHIKEVAKMLHIKENAVRFYEKKGLITPVRDENTYRVYKDSDIQRLHTILLYRNMGFSIETIRELLHQSEGKTTLGLYAQQFQLLNIHIRTLSRVRSCLEANINTLLTYGEEQGQVLASMQETMERLSVEKGWEDAWNFDSWASTYDEVVKKAETNLPFYKNYEEVLDVCARMVLNFEGNVLEIGVGTGNLAGKIYGKRDITGLDQSLEMLVQAKKKLPKLPLCLGTFLLIPYENESYDTVVSSYAFHHCNEQEKRFAILEMKRVLKAHGRIIIADLMFQDNVCRERFTRTCSEEAKAELEDEFFANIDEVRYICEEFAMSFTATQIDDLIWVICIQP